MSKRMSAEELVNSFDSILHEVSFAGGQIVVEQDGKSVAVILSVAAYELLRKRPLAASSEDELGQAAFGMWVDRDDIADDWREDGSTNWESKWVKQ